VVRLVGCQCVLAILAMTGLARANPLEVFGLTSRRAGQANTGVGAADDVSALYYDPAGLVASRGGELVVGTLAAYSHLGINRLPVRLADPIGFQLAVRAPLPLGGALADRFAVGAALHLLPRDLARISAPAPDEPFYPYYGDRLSRVVALPGAAARLGGGVAVGAAVNMLTGLGVVSYPAEGGTRAPDPRAGERIPTTARVIAGVQWQVDSSLRLGAVYRQRFEARYAAASSTIVDGEPVEVDLRASSHFTPHQVAVGLGWTTEAFAAALDIGWAKWSGYAGPYMRARPRQPLDPAYRTPVVPFDDSITVRAGLESLTDAGLVYRGGYGYESSPVPKDQHGVTNLLDGTKHTVAFGGGYVWKKLRLDAHVQIQLVSTRSSSKTVYDGMGTYDPYTSLPDEDTSLPGTQISNQGFPSLKSGGEVFSAGLTLEVPL
jgi:hypothetical protein